MGIDMNLRDIRSPQYSAVTGRTRKVPYASILTALAPTIRADARAEDLDAMREQDLLDTATRFDASQALNREIANTQAEQAEKSMMIQGATLVPQAAYVADKAGLINLKEIAGTVKDKFFGGQSAIPLGKVAGPELVTVGVGESATMTSAAGAGLMGASGETAGALAPELIGEAGVGGSAGVGGTGAGTSAAGVGTYALPAAAAYLGSQAGAYAGHKIGESLDVGGYRERGFVGRVGGATAAGFAFGGPIGAGIGATIGLIDWGFNEGKEFFSDVGHKVGDFAESVWDNTLGQVFCFAAGTPVRMADGGVKPVEELRLLDETLEGGTVYGCGTVLADEIYDHRGVIVSGEHAAFEGGRWIRIHESPNAARIELSHPIPVYPVLTAKHILIVDDRVYADMQETDHGTQVNDAFRLDWLNEQTERNRDLEARYAG